MYTKNRLIIQLLILRLSSQVEDIQKQKKKNHSSPLREGLEPHSAYTTSTVSGTTNPRCLIRERLESRPPSKIRFRIPPDCIQHFYKCLWYSRCPTFAYQSLCYGPLAVAWILSSFGDQRLDSCCLQFMRIHLRGCCLYGYDRRKAFGAKYMAGNPSASREYGKHDENNVEHRGNATTKR